MARLVQIYDTTLPGRNVDWDEVADPHSTWWHTLPHRCERGQRRKKREFLGAEEGQGADKARRVPHDVGKPARLSREESRAKSPEYIVGDARVHGSVSP